MQNICKNIIDLNKEIKEEYKTFPLFYVNVKVIAVSKNQTINKIEEAIKCGQVDFAENYIQEAEEKWVYLKQKYPHVKLHLIGHLQSNKVKKALELFDVIHCLDRLSLAKKISKVIKENNFNDKSFLIQILLDKNSTTKHGLSAKELPEFLIQCKKLELEIKGLMVVAPLDVKVSNENTSQGIPIAPYFAFIKFLSNKYNLDEISMGMSGDYKTALRFGSTMLRIGTRIFGGRA